MSHRQEAAAILLFFVASCVVRPDLWPVWLVLVALFGGLLLIGPDRV